MINKKRVIIVSSIIIVALVVILIITALFKDNNRGADSSHVKSYFENKVLTSFAEKQAIDITKPTLILFHASYCKTCHDFMPAFKQLTKDFDKKYNFMALDIQDPENYPIVIGNVGGIPSLYIFDTEIGNKVHISLSGIRGYNELKEELNRYLRIRSFIDIEKAKAEQEKLMQAYLEEINKNTKKESKVTQ